MIKNIGHYLFIFIITVFSCIALLYVTAWIPQKNIESNILSSAKYVNQEEDSFYAFQKDREYSKVDNYADLILLNIIYNMDQEKLFPSLMESSYYRVTNGNPSLSLIRSIEVGTTPNTPYERYWHGMMVVLRPLLLLTNLQGIRILFSILMLILCGILFAEFKKQHMTACIFAFLVACILCSAWFIPLCIEYSSTGFLMLIFSILMLRQVNTAPQRIFPLFLIAGIMTSFFDFLTTETLTLFIPLIFVLYARYERKTFTTLKDGVLFSVKSDCLWTGGYVGMWVLKWGLASVVLQRNVFLTALDSAKERLYEVPSPLSLPQPINAIIRNICNLLGFQNFKTIGSLFLAILVIIFLIGLIITLWGNNQNCPLALLLFCIALVPYIRFFILNNHANIHHFFTFRAQITTITAIGLALYLKLRRNTSIQRTT